MRMRELERIKRVLDPLTKEHSLRILQLASEKDVTIPELIAKLQLPSSSTYHLVKELERSGLLIKVGGQITKEGRRLEVWRTLVAQLNLTIGRECQLQLIPRRDLVDRLIITMRTLAKGRRAEKDR